MSNPPTASTHQPCASLHEVVDMEAGFPLTPIRIWPPFALDQILQLGWCLLKAREMPLAWALVGMPSDFISGWG